MAELGENTHQLDPADQESINHSTDQEKQREDDNSTIPPSEPHNDQPLNAEGVEGDQDIDREEQAVLDSVPATETRDQGESLKTPTLIQHKREDS